MDLQDILDKIRKFREREEEDEFKDVVQKRLEDEPDQEEILALKYATVLGDYEPNVEHLKKMVEKALDERIDPTLVMALVARESSFDPKAKNYNRDSTDYGYFQLNDKYHDQHKYNIDKHIEAGIEHLKRCLDTANGNERKALSRYNTGSEDSSVGRRYASKVLRLASKISRNLDDAERL